MATRVTLNNAAVNNLLKSPSGPVYRDFSRRVLAIHGKARTLCPVDTGRLRSSIRYSIAVEPKGLVGVVGTDVIYAGWVHEGTKPHIIKPKNKKALFWKGAAHPVRGPVNHPGTTGKPFLVDALKAAK